MTRFALLSVVFLLCAGAAFGQAVGGGALSAQPYVVEFQSHPQRATQQGMGASESLLETSTYLAEKGERPLWEVAKLKEQPPLGDTARVLRKEHESAKKTDKIWVNY
jgi:hypothetical protein